MEKTRKHVDALALARGCFSAHEYRAMEQPPCVLRDEGFYATSTRKEAYLKATGCGLSGGLDRVEVNADPRIPAALLKKDNEEDGPHAWSLTGLEAPPGCHAALANRGRLEIVQRDAWNLA